MSTNTALDQIKNRVEGHAEGPWEVASDTHEYRGGGFMQVDPKVGSRSICDVTDQHKPNAELIAAAPKLLAALEAVQELAASAPRVIGFGGVSFSGILIADNVLKLIEEALS